MANRLERVAVRTLVLGEPGRAAVPERCVDVQVGTRLVAKQVTEDQIVSPTFEQYTPIDPVSVDGQSVIDFTQVQQIYQPLPPGVGDGSSTYTVYVREPVFERQCTGGQPAFPGTPSRVIEDAGPDWRSYARSQLPVPDSGGFTVTLVAPAMVGLSEPVLDGAYSLGVIDYGIYYDGTAVYPVIGGAVGASLGAYSGALSVKVDRQSGRYRTSISGSEVHTANVTQSAPAALVAFLETDDAYVDDPVMFTYASITSSAYGALPVSALAVPALAITPTGVLPQSAYCGALVDGQLDLLAAGTFAVIGAAGPTVETPSQQEGSFGQTAALTGRAEGGQIRGTPMTMLASDAPYTSVMLVASKQQLTATSTGDAPNVAITRIALAASKPVFSSYVITGGVITVEADASAQSMFAAEGPFTQVVGSISRPIMAAYVTSGEVLAAAYSERVAVFEQSVPTRVAVTAITLGELTVDSDVSFTLALTEELNAALSLTDDLTLSRTLQVLVDSGVRLLGSARAPDQVDTQYLVTELTGALSRATGMRFDQFVYWRGRTYGVRKDGLYTVGAAEEMAAEVDFGSTSMGTSRAKNIEGTYIGMGTDGTVYLVAEADGVERVYRAVQREPTMRVKTARGITGRTWNLKLKVVDATAAEIEDLELVVGATRRWTR